MNRKIMIDNFDILNQSFNQFREYYRKVKHIELNSFQQIEEETYKDKTYIEARNRLNLENWLESLIGTGSILENVRDAIEIDSNNFIKWDKKKSTENLHNKGYQLLLDTIEKKVNIKRFESAFYNFYVNDTLTPDSTSMEVFIELFGKKYDLIAYFFFVKNNRKYLPVKPEYFEKAFNLLKIDLKLCKKCSWENYTDFLKINEELKNFLSGKFEDEIRLIDAHSFLWILGEKENKITEIKLDLKTDYKSFVPVNPFQSDKKGKNVDFDKINSWKKILGRLAEEAVLRNEKELVKSYGFDENKVRLVSNNNSLGYDIISIDKENREKYIEVKAVQEGEVKTFYITENELTTLNSNENYYIYLVENVGKKNETIYFLHQPNLNDNEKFEKQIINYRIKCRLTEVKNVRHR